MSPLTLSLKSLRHRKFTVSLTVISLALGVALLLGVERMRREARAGFTNTISQTDLIVGARTGQVSLLLSSVFRIGNPSQNISWETYRKIAKNPQVAWTIPISLGDTHRGYRVLGTTGAYFEHYRYADKRRLELADGVVFADTYDAVIGAEVARVLGYQLDDAVVLAHGAGEVSFVDHADKPFRVAGILNPTGTPVDQTVHVSLAGIEAVHEGWDPSSPGGSAGAGSDPHTGHNHPAPPVRTEPTGGEDPHAGHSHGPGEECDQDGPGDGGEFDESAMLDALEALENENAGGQAGADPHAGHDHAIPEDDAAGGSAEERGHSTTGGRGSAFDRLAAIEAMLAGDEGHDLEPTQITAFLVGMHERADAVFLQRAINTYKGEALTAVMPGVALQELWQVVGVVEKTLLVVSVFVVAVSLAGMLSALMTSLNERRREMAILRSVGARPIHIVSLIVGEAVAVTALACVLGVAILYLLLAVARPVVLAKAGLHLGFSMLSGGELLLLAAVLAVGLLVGLLPAWRCYRNSLADGLTVKV